MNNCGYEFEERLNYRNHTFFIEFAFQKGSNVSFSASGDTILTDSERVRIRSMALLMDSKTRTRSLSFIDERNSVIHIFVTITHKVLANDQTLTHNSGIGMMK